MRIIVRYACGLGNQLFQYAFMQSMKECYPHADVVGDISFYKMNKEHFGFDMPCFFDVDLKTIPYEEARKYYPGYLMPEKRIEQFSSLYQKLEFTPIGTLVNLFANKRSASNAVCLGSEEPNVVYDYMYQLNPKQQKPFYLYGYWQNRVYLEHCSNIHKKIRFKEEILTEEEKLQLEYIRNNDCVSVHVRRGDYLVYPEYNICTLEYYHQALEIVRKKLGDISIIYFSDEPDFIKENFKLRECDRIIANGTSRGGCDMYLMSNCTAHIIANSSFSFWGAYLDHHSDSLVIAPRLFKKTKQLSYSFMVPTHWITLDV